jgi:hypothetical protein
MAPSAPDLAGLRRDYGDFLVNPLVRTLIRTIVLDHGRHLGWGRDRLARNLRPLRTAAPGLCDCPDLDRPVGLTAGELH